MPKDYPPIDPDTIEPATVDMPRVILGGIAVWTIGLLITLAVPALHDGGRAWWPWACVAGVVLGLLGLAYVLLTRADTR
ncbi:DUF2530 domain-containing protein [Arsenicicoccus piscis]|uniref:DUF2530 domain-containing protein n=1 Tax=Arsenicicoccus piscis TaxID=673954 RepID=A0ABQ6HT40_9MICO|nr:DUF2530 domain-containing protein [Arsenicicoccus piscis]MCH8627959.1 DUF2530 domain-containing protein [Arsenicicoccus piscis]GMA20704.1 hypothetical protein GCM10025862_27250 [Arsenicicoccus piscis]